MDQATPPPLTDAEGVYKSFLESLNGGSLDQAEKSVDPQHWREICVGFTNGKIEWAESRRSMERVWKGIPDLAFQPAHIVSDGTQVVAVGTVHGKQTGNLFGAPRTNRPFQANMFDYVQIRNGKIVDRIQQTDTLGPFRQLFGPLLIGVGVGAVLFLVGLGVLIGRFLL